MGFDLSGLKAKSKVGEYFRNNVWFWKPLARYVLENCEMSEIESEHWFTNDGQMVSEETAIKIADTLDRLVKSGHTKKYKKAYDEAMKSLPLETCINCEGTGRRDDEFVKGKCNGCNGKGKQKNFMTNYPFVVSNVKAFSKFCRESGGFDIY